MNGFGLHVIPMVGLILLSWLGLRSLGMERGAPLAAPGWPSGCTLPEVELPGGQSSQAAFAICPAMKWPPWLHMIPDEKLRVATLYGRLPTSPGSLAHNRLSHSSGTVRNLSLTLPNTSENFKCCTSCSQTLAPFSHTSQTNWP